MEHLPCDVLDLFFGLVLASLVELCVQAGRDEQGEAGFCEGTERFCLVHSGSTYGTPGDDKMRTRKGLYYFLLA